MTLETIAFAILMLSLVLGFLVEYFALARSMFGKPAGKEPSLLRLLWLSAASFMLLQVAAWVYAVLVPRDPSMLVSRAVYFFTACMSIGFAFYAARELGHLLRAARG